MRSRWTAEAQLELEIENWERIADVIGRILRLQKERES